MKTPITYYGGKQNLVSIIIPLVPPHGLYCEPFTGGAALFFAKKPAPVEILNDLNGEVVNFWEVLKHEFDALNAEIQTSLYSRKLHRNAAVIYTNADMFDRVKRAWAVWYLTNTSFGAMLDTSWVSDIRGKRINAFVNKQVNFTKQVSERLKNTHIEGCDAIKAIHDHDRYDAFFYVDPPYVGADQGHYAGYSQSQFDMLLHILSEIKGMFLLSSYLNEGLSRFVKKNSWHQVEIRMNNPMVSSQIGYKIEKVEVLTANYPISKDGLYASSLFYCEASGSIPRSLLRSKVRV